MNLQRFILIGRGLARFWTGEFDCDESLQILLSNACDPGVGHRCARPTPGYWIEQPVPGCRPCVPSFAAIDGGINMTNPGYWMGKHIPGCRRVFNRLRQMDGGE